MPEIGPTLREARMRARIDISEIEAETKIRAKYLRALENEEWDLLPGPTFVKSFLRTYSDALGLDSRALVEEYKLRHERLSEVDLQPIAPLGADRRSRRATSSIPRSYVAWGLVLALLASIFVLTQVLGGSSDKKATTATVPATATTPTGAATLAELQIIPIGKVTVCLTAAGRRTLLRNATLKAGAKLPTYRSSEFRLAMSNTLAALRVNSKLQHLPRLGGPVAYSITAGGRRVLPEAQKPTCR
jgi:cytoskeleton protein RodZ